MAKIICIDDDKDILDTCEVVLQGIGHTVVTAINGKEGFEKASKGKFDLVIMDVMMDDATEGFTTAQKFRKVEGLKYTPIMMLTSVNETSPQKFSEKDGEFLPVDAFMEKPIKPKEFVAKVKELLALKKDQVNVEGRTK
jgi:two-component system alkaline phosphatase synthesis response regulator PhoP